MTQTGTIWKYSLELTDNIQAFEMPVGAEILTTQVQRGVVCIWALVESTVPKEKRLFVIHGTGHPIDSREKLKYIGTVQQSNGMLVWHVFELLNR